MTTQDHPTQTPSQTEQAASTARPESPSSDAPVGETPPVRGQADALTSDTTQRSPADPSETQMEPTAEQADRPETAQAEPSDPAATTEISLFGATELSGFRSRWDDVQAAFVDDPRECVQKADALVSEVVDQLTAGFSEARS